MSYQNSLIFFFPFFSRIFYTLLSSLLLISVTLCFFFILYFLSFFFLTSSPQLNHLFFFLHLRTVQFLSFSPFSLHYNFSLIIFFSSSIFYFPSFTWAGLLVIWVIVHFGEKEAEILNRWNPLKIDSTFRNSQYLGRNEAWVSVVSVDVPVRYFQQFRPVRNGF